MLATIDIDLGPLADEWEAVRIGAPKKDEHYVVICGGVSTVANDCAASWVKIIVRRKWVFPTWLKARWYAEDSNGLQYAYNEKPSLGDAVWIVRGASQPHRLNPSVIDIPKIGGDWRQSLRENPNWRPDNGQKDT